MLGTIKDTSSTARYGSFAPVKFSSAGHARYRPSQEDYIEIFNGLLKKWRFSMQTVSSTHEILRSPEFQGIVDMGEKAIPLIIDEIRVHPDHLMAALNMITGTDPVPDNARGDFTSMANAWIAWHERRT